jgi:hypothetical protein
MPPYTIPSYMARPGTAYQPGVDLVPLNVKRDARFIGAAYPNLYPFDSAKLLDQSPLHLGTRRTGQQGRCWHYDGTDDYSTGGDIGLSVKTIAFRIKPIDGVTSGTSYLIDLNGTDYIKLSAQGLTGVIQTVGFSGATITKYVDGSVGAVISDDKFYSVVVVSDTGFSASDFEIGRLSGTGNSEFEIFDVRLSDQELTAGQVANYHTFGASGDTVTWSDWWKSDDQSGVTGRSTIGGRPSLTHTNITAANFHATQDVWSFQNQVGYNLSGAVFIPRDESDPTNDVLGNPLTYTGTRPNDADLINSSCLTLNGTNQAVRVANNTALDITDNLTVSVWAKNDASSLPGGPEVLIAKYDPTGNKRSYQLYLDITLKLNVTLGDPADGTVEGIWTSANAVAINSTNNYSFSFAAGVIKFYLNGLEIAGTLSSGSIPTSLYLSTADLTVGSSLSSNAVSNPWDGQIFDARVYAGDSTVLTAAQILSIYEDGINNVEFAGQDLRARYVCAEGAGAGVLDYSGNGNDGTIENAASNWGVTQDVLHSNLLEGFSLYEHASSDPIRVKFVNGSLRSFTPPTGYTLTGHYPAGNYPIPAETEINFNPDSTPEMGGQLGSYTAPAAHAFSDDIDPGATDQGFARQSTSREDRFAIFAEPQTGAALTTIERWTT